MSLYSQRSPGAKRIGSFHRRGEDLVCRVVRALAADVERAKGFAEAGEAGRMREQVSDRDRAPAVGYRRQVPVYRVVERDLPFFDEKHDRGGRELLCHGRKLEHGIGRDRRVVLEIGQAIAAQLRYDAFLDDRHGEARDAPLRHLGLDVCVDRVRRCRVRCQAGKGEQQRRDGPHGYCASTRASSRSSTSMGFVLLATSASGVAVMALQTSPIRTPASPRAS